VLLIPKRLMRARPVPAKLVSSSSSSSSSSSNGDVGAGDAPAVQVISGQNLCMRPADAGPSTCANSGPARSGWFSGARRVLSGSDEVFAAKVLRPGPLEVVTPSAVRRRAR
jgi:hypothetical protein